jgi:hypothetical protein
MSNEWRLLITDYWLLIVAILLPLKPPNSSLYNGEAQIVIPILLNTAYGYCMNQSAPLSSFRFFIGYWILHEAGFLSSLFFIL